MQTSRANKKASNKLVFPKSYSTNIEYKSLSLGLYDYMITHQVSIGACIYFLANNLFAKLPKSTFLKAKVDRYQNEYSVKFGPLDKYISSEFNIPNPTGVDDDFLGCFYQAVSSEGKRNQLGMYYTPRAIVSGILDDLEPHHEGPIKLLDPCCGSGAFLFNANNNILPENLIGLDIDPIACMIAKANLIIKYHSHDFYPNIYESNFLTTCIDPSILANVSYIVSNPPWGADTSSKESADTLTYKQDTFISFLHKALDLVSLDGTVNFLVPSAFLNIKRYTLNRRTLFLDYNVTKVTIYPNMFTGVVTDFISITVSKSEILGDYFSLDNKQTGKCLLLKKSKILSDTNCIIPIDEEITEGILSKVFNRDYQTLQASIFCLGIVTGNNKTKVLTRCSSNPVCEKIYTGKDVQKYRLGPSSKYIDYDRTTLQQVALEKYYRAPEKLVYKFISKSLVFSYDNNKALFLNSANILIPNIPGMSIKTVLAFLNSELYTYIYRKKFNDIKVVKYNLVQLPFPKIPTALNITLSRYVDMYLLGNDRYLELIDLEIFDFFDLEPEDILEVQTYNARKV